MRLYLKYRLKSGALQFTIFIAVLIALILSGLILYVYSFLYLKEQSKSVVQSIQVMDSAIAYGLSLDAAPDTLAYPYAANENQSVKIRISRWGIFEKIFVVSQNRRKKFTKAALIGSVIDAQSATLYLQNDYNPLNLLGQVSIRGDAYLPEGGARSGYIGGQSYQGSEPVHGRMLKSESHLPEPAGGYMQELLFYTEKFKPGLPELNIDAGTKAGCSFGEKTKNYYSDRPVILENVVLCGNMIIKSGTSITVKRSAVLKDLILIAPSIEVQDEVRGNFQAIASKKIAVGRNCSLSYPSALVLVQDNKDVPGEVYDNGMDNKIAIDQGTMLAGSVAYLQTRQLTDFAPQIVLAQGAKVKGQVYCQGNFELRGDVKGSVYTRQFILKRFGTVYLNHICDASIENEGLPDFGGIIFKDNQKMIMKWLY